MLFEDGLKRARRERKPDPIFDALAEVSGIEIVTDLDRGPLNKACKALKQKRATVQEIRDRADAYKKKWPNVAFTAIALAKNWHLFAPRANARPSKKCSVCHHEIVNGTCYGCSEREYARSIGK